MIADLIATSRDLTGFDRIRVSSCSKNTLITDTIIKEYSSIEFYSEDEEIIELYGYQCKEGNENSGQEVHSEFTNRFVLKGILQKLA